MKVKILILLAAIFLLCNVSSAQGVGAYKAKKTEVVKKRKPVSQREGFFIMPEIEVGSIVIVDRYKINAIFGYEFNNHFALGIGTGFNSIYIHKESIWLKTGDKLNNLPLYINIHGDVFKAKTSLYYSLDMGFMLPLKKLYYSYDFYDVGNNYVCYYEYYFKGLMITPEIGVRINNCYLGVNCMIANDYHNYVLPNGSGSGFGMYEEFIFSIKFGYKIPLNIGR